MDISPSTKKVFQVDRLAQIIYHIHHQQHVLESAPGIRVAPDKVG